jgi:glycosyltransferase involved in cell wall biosynthesis
VNERGYDGAKIRIIRNGVEPDSCTRIADPRRRAEIAASLGLADGDAVVGILAVLRPEKDHETFLRAGRRIVDLVPRARLLIVGDGPERPKLEALASELGLGDRVVFAGMRADIGAVLSVVDVSVLSSFTIECFPFSILEAMSASVPAVCTAVGGLPELVEHGVTGYLVPPRDPEGLARAVVRIIGEDGESARMGAAARERLERLFTLEASVRETERAFAEMLGRR